MPFPQRIELTTATDRTLRTVVWLAWLMAGCSIALHAPRMADWLLAVSGLLLIGSFPARRSPARQAGLLVLHADGKALWGKEQGVWLPGAWCTRHYSAVRFCSGSRSHTIWISAKSNHAAGWRHLSVWLRFPPHQSGRA